MPYIISNANLGAVTTESIFHGDPGDLAIDPISAANWCKHEVRSLRYRVYFGMYRNDLYSLIRRLAFSYKAGKGLYRYIRGIYNPAARLVKFRVAHVHGGRLDPLCGDGNDQPTCLPFTGIESDVREAIANFLRDSRWAQRKNR